MKLLMLQQPWLNLIILGQKTLESRMWTRDCAYRGEILLCASKKPQTLADVYSIMTPEQYKRFLDIRAKLSHDIFRPLGVAGCVVNMTDYRPMNAIEDVNKAFVKFHPERKVLVFERVRPVASFPVKGMLGLLNCPAEYTSQIRFA